MAEEKEIREGLPAGEADTAAPGAPSDGDTPQDAAPVDEAPAGSRQLRPGPGSSDG